MTIKNFINGLKKYLKWAIISVPIDLFIGAFICAMIYESIPNAVPFYILFILAALRIVRHSKRDYNADRKKQEEEDNEKQEQDRMEFEKKQQQKERKKEEKKFQERTRKRREQEEKQQQERKKLLTSRFGEEDADKILNGDIWIDMTKERLIESWGNAQDEKEDVTKNKIKLKWYYNSRTTRQGTIVYEYEVRLENDIVVGWKELE